jgi:aldose 1-epimerase
MLLLFPDHQSAVTMNRNMTLAGLVIMTMLMLPDCQTKTKQDKSTSTMEMKLLDRGKFQTTYKGKQTDLFTLKNSRGMVVQATNYGGKIQAIIVPDKDGEFADVCFGYESIEECLNGDKYFGALIGRFGNRIAGGKFTLDGVEYTLPQNNGPNTLHGGESGFDDAVWDAEELETSKGPAIRFSYLSVDGEQGFPGNLRPRWST